ncbi:hypothetical protein [Nocardiopsis sp. FR4]|uniref:hypothetical protein n=1 Tax=Nocardiopsis sp. FR4 TaxID=2605985 RepID=UPI00135C4885|nr:hypothetical protein [Nocardiopsis sp. FR4]
MTFLPIRLQPGRLLGPAPAGGGDRPSAAGFRLGSPGAPSLVPTLLICLFDNSGSVISPSGTDPLSNRFAEVEYAFAVVAKRAAPHELGAVLHFDSPCRGDVAPVALNRGGIAKLQGGLVVPGDGAGSSALLPSLRQAVKLTEGYPQHAATLAVLSDFSLLDANPTAALRELAMFPGEVHAVVLGGHLRSDAFDPRITVTHVQREDPPGAVARALFASLITHRRGGRPASP